MSVLPDRRLRMTAAGMLVAGLPWVAVSLSAIDEAETLRHAAIIDTALASASGRGVRLELERNTLRPGERYLEYFLSLEEGIPWGELRLRERLYRPGREVPSTEEVFEPDRPLLLRRLDLREPGITEGRLDVALLQGDRVLGVAEAFVRGATTGPAPAPGEHIPLYLHIPDGVEAVQNYPVTFGVPFPPGGLWDLDTIKLVDREERDIPFQAEITGRWALGGSAKWVRFDALVDSSRGLAVIHGAPGPGAIPRDRLTVTRTDDGVTVDTGVARYQIEPGGALVAALEVDGRAILSGEGRGLYVVDQQGRTAVASKSDARLEVEADGPVAAGLKIEGFYRTEDGEPLARHITRLEFFAGRKEIRIIHTLVLIRDSNEIWFREIGWELPVAPGRAARALFNLCAEDATAIHKQPLRQGIGSAFMFQQEGRRLSIEPHSQRPRWITRGRGGYRFVLAFQHGDEPPEIVREGERMGDWVALAGEQAALLVACRDSALQYPKEFEVRGDRVILRLFSNRGGEELDFRAATLVKAWGLTGLPTEILDPEMIADITAHESNAIGWSRTHQLLLAPLPPDELETGAASLAGLFSHEVYVHPDPAWIHRSRAMGPLYPRDTGRFPEAEEAIAHYMQVAGLDQVPGDIYHGFMHYYVGPHYNHPNRWSQVYDTHTCYGAAYARSGDRRYRRLAQGTVRAYMDAYLAHWDGPGKVRGLITRTRGSGMTGKNNFPYYWEENTDYNFGDGTDLKRLLWDYYLSGYRRSADLVAHYGEGLLRTWVPDTSTWKPIMVLRLLLQAYELTWDPRLRTLATATLMQNLYHPEGELGITKRRPYSSTTYKTDYDVDVPIESWLLTGEQRYLAIVHPLTEHLWRTSGLAGRSTGLGMNFLHAQTKSPAVAADLAHALRAIPAATYQPRADYGPAGLRYRPLTWSQLSSVLRGLPYAMDVVAATDADRRFPASLLDFTLERVPASVFVHTDAEQALEVLARMPRPALSGSTGEGLRLIPHAFYPRGDSWGQDLHQVSYTSGGSHLVRIPYDAPPGAYEIRVRSPGRYRMVANRRTPLVLYSPDPWQPAFTHPATLVYFKVPEGAQDARIRFENDAMVFTPDGTRLREGRPLRGWVELPGEMPGIWGFGLLEPGSVQGENFPPYYAMHDPAFYFEPLRADERDAGESR